MRAAAVIPRAFTAPRNLVADGLLAGILLLSVIGVGVSSYLVYAHYSGTPLYCEGPGGCDVVQASEYAKVVGVPVAVLGLALYVGLVGAALGGLLWPVALGEASALGLFGLGLTGFIYSGFLTWVEIYRIQAICLWCVVSASLLTIIFVLSVLGLILRPAWEGEAEES